MNSCGQPFYGQLWTVTSAEKQRSSNFWKVRHTIFSLVFAKDTDIRQIKLKNLWKPDREKLVPKKIKRLPEKHILNVHQVISWEILLYALHILSSLSSVFAPY